MLVIQNTLTKKPTSFNLIITNGMAIAKKLKTNCNGSVTQSSCIHSQLEPNGRRQIASHPRRWFTRERKLLMKTLQITHGAFELELDVLDIEYDIDDAFEL